MEIEIDTSNIQQAPATQSSSWRAPRHVYFGKKGADGIMEDEPVYVHRPFPAMLYKVNTEKKLMACIVQNDAELKSRAADGWENSPEKFGIFTAPSFEQINAMKEAAAAEQIVPPPATTKAAKKAAEKVVTPAEPAADTVL